MSRPSLRDQQGAALISVVGLGFIASILVATILMTVTNLNTQTHRDQDFHVALGAAEAGIDELLYQLNADPYFWEQIRDGTSGLPALDGWVTIPGGDTESTYRYDATSFVEEEGTIRVVATGSVRDRQRTLDVTLRRRNFLDYLYFTEFETRPPAAYNTWPPLEEDKEFGRFESGAWIGSQSNSQNLDGNVRVAFVGEDAQDKAEEQCSWYRYSSSRPADLADPSGDPAADQSLVVPQSLVDAGAYPQVGAPDDDPATADGRNPRCHEPHWVSRNTFTGPFHTNDALAIRVENTSNPPRWFGPTTTSSWAAAPDDSDGWLDVMHVINSDGSPRPIIVDGQDDRLLYDAPLRMPPSNDSLRLIADRTDGCLLRGPTRVYFHVSGGVGHVAVLSPLSDGRTCGDQTLDSDGYANVRVDSIVDGVLFVDNAAQSSCTGTGRASDLPLQGHGVIPARDNDIENENVTPYTCWHGDALIGGDVKGRLTVGAAHDAIIIDDVHYDGTSWPNPPSTDETVLGIIGNRFVYYFNPVSCRYWWDHLELERNDAEQRTVCLHAASVNYNNSSSGVGGLQGPEVYAAILSVQHAMTTQNSGLGGSKGQLRIMGAIGQRYRGNLGTAAGYYLTPGVGDGDLCRDAHGSHSGVDNGYCSAGYGKDFRYDERLRYLSPPHFLSPLETSWGIAGYAEAAIEDFSD